MSKYVCRKCLREVSPPTSGFGFCECKNCGYITEVAKALELGRTKAASMPANHEVESLKVDLEFQKQVNIAGEAAREHLTNGIMKAQAEIERLRLLVDQQTRLLEEIKPNTAKMEGNDWFDRRDSVLKNKGHIKPQS